MRALRPRHAARLALLSATLAHACAFELREIVVDPSAADASTPDTQTFDATDEGTDSASEDRQSVDAPAIDTPSVDTPSIDAPTIDAEVDARTIDAPIDAPSLPDISSPDISAPDVTVPDVVDAGSPDVSRDVAPDVTGCAASQTSCGGACVDLSSDATHCGACATRCAAGEACAAGRCRLRAIAGAACTNPDPDGGVDPACGSTLRCRPSITTPLCTVNCTDSASQAVERAACGGGDSTCLTRGEGTNVESYCTETCTPGAVAGTSMACRAGFVCTGWWFTRPTVRQDTPGCAPFCVRDGDCPSGLRCNTRMGWCATRGYDPLKLPDGSPCDPTMYGLAPGETVRRNIQCRGACYGVNPAERTQGVCGSMLALPASSTCPDDPAFVLPETGMTADDLTLCIARNCAHNSDCMAPHVCRYREYPAGTIFMAAPPACQYPSTAQPTGIP